MLALYFLMWVGTAGAAEAWLLRDVRVLDAHGPRHVEALVVRDGRIASVGAAPADPSGLTVVDLDGATVIPGLFDVHVHLSMIPGAALRDDTPEQVDAQWRQQLRAYVACGVTTVLDTGILPEHARAFLALRDEGTPSPDLHFLGPLLSPPEGYVHSVIPAFPAAASREEVVRQMDGFADLTPDGVKVTMERGLVMPIWPLHTPEMRRVIREEASARGWPLYIHAMSAEEYAIALDMEPRAMVHPPEDPAPELVQRLREGKVWVTTTISAVDNLLTASEPWRIEDPLVELTVPDRQLATAQDEDTWREVQRRMGEVLVPRVPGFLRRIGAAVMGRPRSLQRRTEHMQRDVLHLSREGVPLVLGSDSGNWPLFPYLFHGPSTLRELELVVEAGLTPLEALTIATLHPARMLGIDGAVGTLEAGQRADLIVLGADPLADIRAVRDARYVMRAGELRTPAEWIAR